MSNQKYQAEEAKAMADLKLKRCRECGRMVKRGSDRCRCGVVISEQSCLLHFQAKPRMFGFIRRFAEQRGITIGEAMVGFLALGVKVFPMYAGANVTGLVPWISEGEGTFDILTDAREDIYTKADGVPL